MAFGFHENEGFNPDATANPTFRGANRVQFSMQPFPDEVESAKQGRPVHRETEFVTIFTGDRTNIPHRPVTEQDRRMYAREYEAWKRGEDQDAAVGTLLSDVTWITRSLIEDLKYFKIRTVEQLAGVSDAQMQQMGPGWTAHVQKARDYLEEAKGNAPLVKMRAELSQRDSLIDALQKQVTELGQKLEKQARR